MNNTQLPRSLSFLLALVAAASVGGCLTPMRHGGGSRSTFPDRTVAYGGAAAMLFQAKATIGKTEQTVRCLMPPAQAATTISLKGAGKVTAGGVPIEVDGEAATGITQLFSQTAATLHMQMAGYRICEAFSNGSLTAAEYQAELAKLILAAQDLAKAELTRQEAAVKGAEAKAADANARTEEAKTDATKARLNTLERLAPLVSGPDGKATATELRDALAPLL